MSIALWIALGLLAWVVVPLPLAILVGRLMRDGAEPADLPVMAGSGLATGHQVRRVG